MHTHTHTHTHTSCSSKKKEKRGRHYHHQLKESQSFLLPGHDSLRDCCAPLPPRLPLNTGVSVQYRHSEKFKVFYTSRSSCREMEWNWPLRMSTIRNTVLCFGNTWQLPVYFISLLFNVISAWSPSFRVPYSRHPFTCKFVIHKTYDGHYSCLTHQQMYYVLSWLTAGWGWRGHLESKVRMRQRTQYISNSG